MISIAIMIGFDNPIRKFIDNHSSVQILGLAFLISIGFMFITEAIHLSNKELFKRVVGTIPKGHLCFAITFSLFVKFFVDFLNFKDVKKIEINQ